MKLVSGEFREIEKQKKSRFPQCAVKKGNSLLQGYHAHSWKKHDFRETEDKDASLGSRQP